MKEKNKLIAKAWITEIGEEGYKKVSEHIGDDGWLFWVHFEKIKNYTYPERFITNEHYTFYKPQSLKL